MVKINEGLETERYGYFHTWGTFADEDGSSVMGVVEHLDGTCDCYNCNQIKFLDNNRVVCEKK